MTQAIIQAAIDDTKVAIMAVREVDNLVNNGILIHTSPRSGVSTLKQPTFHWKATDKCHELCYYEIEVKYIFMTTNYNIQESEKVPRILNLLGHQGTTLVQGLNDEEQENAKQVQAC